MYVDLIELAGLGFVCLGAAAYAYPSRRGARPRRQDVPRATRIVSKGLRGGFWYQTMCAWERTVQADLTRPIGV